MLKKLLITCICMVFCFSCESGKINKSLTQYLYTTALNPQEYLIEKIKENDVVFIGEMHEQDNTLEFIAESMDSMQKAGMRIFATEFLRSHNTEKINKLVNEPVFNREAVIDLYRDFAWIWSFNGYIDIVESIWKVNQKQLNNIEKIKIIGLDFEWKDWSGAHIESTENRDLYMSKMFLNAKSVIPGKSVIHTGFAHTLLNEKIRGASVAVEVKKNTVKNTVFTVCMHHSISDDFLMNSKKVKLVIEKGYKKINRSYGVDISGSPFSGYFVKESQSQQRASSSLDELTDGYIILVPIADIKHTKYIDNFINEKNFEKAKEIIKTRNWFEFDDSITINQLNEMLKRFMEG